MKRVHSKNLYDSIPVIKGRRVYALAIVVLVIIQGACSNNALTDPLAPHGTLAEEMIVTENDSTSLANPELEAITPYNNGGYREDINTYSLNVFGDVRGGVVGNDRALYTADLTSFGALMQTLTFNESTIWPEDVMMPEDNSCQPAYILEHGKNPGLCVRSIHERGITGSGVSVAIIDQAMPVNHPEYNGKIASYVNLGIGSFSMHGPGVTSLLVGEHVGTAPGSKVYYFVAERYIDGRPDASTYAEAVEQIIDINSSLPESERIRVISVSASPTPSYDVWINSDQYIDSVIRAQEAGILVLDCSLEHGFVRVCSYSFENPEDVTLCRPGFLDGSTWMPSQDSILVPVAYRTIAEVYSDGDFSYAYFGDGGLSWGIPYAAGVFALGWEINPDLSPDEMVNIVFETAYIDSNGNKYIFPTAFIDYIENT